MAFQSPNDLPGNRIIDDDRPVTGASVNIATAGRCGWRPVRPDECVANGVAPECHYAIIMRALHHTALSRIVVPAVVVVEDAALHTR